MPETKPSVSVIGGGIAGVAAATMLAERGWRVHLLEREHHLGGRAGGWAETLPDGTPYHMERGFHAFFRQYYSLRALLRRIDPSLALLHPLHDYPILGPDHAVESFAGLPATAPLNVAALTLRTRSLAARDLLHVNAKAALAMLRFDMQRTYAQYDGISARDYLDSLRFPPRARRMLFDVFSHSFFNPEEEMSAAELLMMFHFYFVGNREGLVFDVTRRPLSQAIWAPLRERLEALGARVHLGCAAFSVTRVARGWRVKSDAEALRCDALVIATDLHGLQTLIARSPDLQVASWCEPIDALRTTRPFAVWRLWLDGPTLPERPGFAGTTGMGPLSNISLYHLLQDESRDWARRTGGSVVELHAYALSYCIDTERLRRALRDGLHAVYPETRRTRILHERLLVRRDCPAFRPGDFARRPKVETPWATLTLAGDHIRLPIPSALMERAAASGFLAANRLLRAFGATGERLRSVPRRGLLSAPSPRWITWLP